MTKMPCSVTDDVLSDPDYRYESPYQDETGLSRVEEMSLRLEAMSDQIKNAMRSVDQHHTDLRKDLMAIQNGIFLTQVDLDDVGR